MFAVIASAYPGTGYPGTPGTGYPGARTIRLFCRNSYPAGMDADNLHSPRCETLLNFRGKFPRAGLPTSKLSNCFIKVVNPKPRFSTVFVLGA
eukprot:1044414-Rhodomonas_salina.3